MNRMFDLVLHREQAHPVEGAKHKPFLPHYERIRTLAQWRSLGFDIEVDKDGQITQRKNRHLYRFARLWDHSPSAQEAIATGKRWVTHFYPMLDYVRAGVPFDDFVSHPEHYRDFCRARLAQDANQIDDAIGWFGKALAGDPNEVRYAEFYYKLRVDTGDLLAPALELAFFANEVDSMIHTGRVFEWVKLFLKNDRTAEAAQIIRRTATLLTDKLAGCLPKGRYSGGDDTAFVAYKREQFHKKLVQWAGMRKYQPLMNEIEKQGGLH